MICIGKIVICEILRQIRANAKTFVVCINQSEKKNFSSALIVVFCVSVFILAGFEHSVADMFYFMLSLPVKRWILPLIVITLGNVVGGNLFCFITKMKRD